MPEPESVRLGIGDVGELELGVATGVKEKGHALGEAKQHHEVRLDLGMRKSRNFLEG